MRKNIMRVILLVSVLILAACGEGEETAVEETDEEEGNGTEETITFGHTGWSSTQVPTEIAKLILEEAGYNVEISLLDQPVIFEGLKSKEVDFFMDAWLPHTEEALWAEYEEHLIKVAESYSNVPLGWVVPTNVEEDSIEDIKQNPEKFDGKVYTIGAGAGIVTISEEVIEDYGLDMYELVPSSEGAMLGELYSATMNEEPVIVTGWRPHSMFTQYDLKFLEEPNENFKYDNIYVLSYNEIEEEHPEAYEILSKWSIEVDDIEEMMYENEINGVAFEELAQEWVDENRDKVDEMLE